MSGGDQDSCDTTECDEPVDLTDPLSPGASSESVFRTLLERTDTRRLRTSPSLEILGPLSYRARRLGDAPTYLQRASAVRPQPQALRVDGIPLLPSGLERTPSTWWTEIPPSSNPLADAAM